MSEWKKVKLKDVSLTIQPGPFGTQLHNSDYTNYGIPVIMPRDMIDGRVLHERLEYVSEETANRISRHKVYAGDIIVARKGDVRKCIFIRESENGWITGSDCIKMQLNNTLCNSLYIYYQLRSPYIGAWLQKVSKGATMPSLNTSLLGDIEIGLPPLPTQHRIASILSRYDSLIENYQKQIKLLEEAAQRLYKEWFVDLHFSGHENVKIVDGVPEGWTPSQLGQLAEFKRGKTITKKDVINGDIPVVAGGLEPAYYCNKSNTAERVITISGSGVNAGFTRMYFEKVWASDCSFVDASVTPFLHFVYCYLKDNKTTIDNMQKGAAQPHVYAKDINSLELCIPIENVLKSFEEKASKYFDTISSLQTKIRLLTEARDRLLPKLMSGEIEI
jgi:type I restriction enzyme S subunit